jgi:RimJ/RimL family protein N-acetyltransferase
VDFAIETLQVRRLEARSALANGRGNGALHKLGASREAVLRKSFLKDGEYMDQVLWSITAEDWRFFRAPAPARVH